MLINFSYVLKNHPERWSSNVVAYVLIGNVRIVAYMYFDVSDTCLALTMSRMDSINNIILNQNSTTGNMAHLHW